MGAADGARAVHPGHHAGTRRGAGAAQAGEYPGPDGRRPRGRADREIQRPVHHGLDLRPALGADPAATAGWRAGRGGAAQAPGDRHDVPVRRLAGRVRAVAVRHRRAVHAQPGARHPPPGPVGGGVRHGPRRAADPPRRRVGGASGRRRVQPHAGAHPPLPGAADRDAGRRVARSAHAADPAAPGAGDAAADRGTAARTWPK